MHAHCVVSYISVFRIRIRRIRIRIPNSDYISHYTFHIWQIATRQPQRSPYQTIKYQFPSHIPPPFWYVHGHHTALTFVLKNKKITDAHWRLWLVNWPNRVSIRFGPIEQPPTTATATGNERQLRLTGLFTQHLNENNIKFTYVYNIYCNWNHKYW